MATAARYFPIISFDSTRIPRAIFAVEHTNYNFNQSNSATAHTESGTRPMPANCAEPDDWKSLCMQRKPHQISSFSLNLYLGIAYIPYAKRSERRQMNKVETL